MGLKVVTWNVNGIRARAARVSELMTRERPDVLCLQEIKAAASQVPPVLQVAGYRSYWHAETAYSGVALHIRADGLPGEPEFRRPTFDYENRVVTAQIGELTVASIYVPNGGKDFDAKLRFLESMDAFVEESHRAGRILLLCGDLNVARTDMDVHPRERKPGAIGQRPEERARLERIVGRGLVDVGRALDPDNDQLFTWWAPWRHLRQRNIGWRLDYILASEALGRRAVRAVVLSEMVTSDHAPVLAEFD